MIPSVRLPPAQRRNRHHPLPAQGPAGQAGHPSRRPGSPLAARPATAPGPHPAARVAAAAGSARASGKDPDATARPLPPAGAIRHRGVQPRPPGRHPGRAARPARLDPYLHRHLPPVRRDLRRRRADRVDQRGSALVDPGRPTPYLARRRPRRRSRPPGHPRWPALTPSRYIITSTPGAPRPGASPSMSTSPGGRHDARRETSRTRRP